MMGVTAAFLCAALALSGCGSTGETAYRIGIVQQDEHSSLDAATQGFEDKLMELLGEENVTFDYQNAQGEQANSTTIATKFVSDGCDLILANGTTALQSAAAATADIPIVGTSVTDYIAAGAVNSNEKPGTNVTGVSDLGEIKAQVDVLLTFCKPDTKIAVVYCSAEPNSIYPGGACGKISEAAQTGLRYLHRCGFNDVQAVLTKAVQECGAIFIPTDNTMANSMEIVKNITIPAGAYLCRGGIYGAASVRWLRFPFVIMTWGVKAAEMAYNILVNGTKPAEMPIAFVSDGATPKYNAEIARALGITPPADMEALEETME